MTRTVAFALAATGLFAGLAPADTIVYTEVFPNNGNTDSMVRVTDQGWSSQRGGGTTNQLQLFGPTGGAAEVAPVNSFPNYGVNPPTPTGYAFFSPQIFDVTIFTSEFSLPSQFLSRVTFDTRHNNQQNTTAPDIDRLAVRIGTQWYLSGDFVTYTGDGTTWQSNTIDATTTLWGLGFSNVTDPPGAGPREPAVFNSSLPVGLINAIGIFTTDNPVGGNNLRGNHRYDNFSVYSSQVVPEPATLGVLGLLAGVGGLVARRRKAA